MIDPHGNRNVDHVSIYPKPAEEEPGDRVVNALFGLGKLWVLGWLVGMLFAVGALFAFGWVALHFVMKLW